MLETCTYPDIKKYFLKQENSSNYYKKINYFHKHRVRKYLTLNKIEFYTKEEKKETKHENLT